MVPIPEDDCKFLVIGEDLLFRMQDQGCSQSVNVLTRSVSVDPIRSPLTTGVDRNDVGEFLTRWDTALRDTDCTVIPGSRVEEHAVVME